MTTLIRDPAADAYGVLAPYYDLFTGHHGHDVWLARLERLALECGLEGRRVLDVGCGTGKSFLPLLERGYDVSACDISPEMLEVAGTRARDGADLFQADVRELPGVGPFDLVTCLDDALNYLLEDDDLVRAMRSMAGVLAPHGLVVFDLNTRATYRTMYSGAQVVEQGPAFLCWRGHGADGARASATMEIFTRRQDGAWERTQSVHHQRHWTRDDVDAGLDAAGLRLVAVRGQRIGADLEDHVDELDHTKVVYVAALDC